MEEFSNETIGSMNSQVEQVSRLVEDLQQLSLADEGLLNIDWKIDNRPMRQDKEETFLENGAFYITKRKNLL